jgi:signal transduction histidine kinase
MEHNTGAFSERKGELSGGEGSPAVSKLAAKVAHELNNPLDAVLRFVSLAQRKAKSGDYSDIERYLADAQFGLERMAESLRELMDIGRKTNDILRQPEESPLANLVGQAMRTAAAQAEQKHVAMVVRNCLPAQTAPHYDQRLSQVLSNLLKNSLDAAPEGSTVRLTISLGGASQPASIVITVEDSGPGVPAELLPHLFTSFITTKPEGTGHGLGLAISRELVISLGGILSVENRTEPQSGCLASVRLPLA